MTNTLKQLKRAKEIVDRYLASNSVFPRELRDCGRSDPARQQEYRDACKIKTWKYSLLGKNRYTCCDEVRDYLDENMPGWRDRVYSHKGRSSSAQMIKASEIVQRYRERGCVRPRRLNDPARKQEYKDAVTLSTWKSALKGHNRVTCSANLRDYMDENMPGWRDDYTSHGSVSNTAASTTENSNPTPPVPRKDILLPGMTRPPPTTEELMPVATAIVHRYQQRGCVLPSLKAECRNDPSRAQECKDAGILHSWKIHTNEKLTPEVLRFLDASMPGWKKNSSGGTLEGQQSSRQKPPQSPRHQLLSKAREVVQRCLLSREHCQNPNWLPRHLVGRQETAQLILEQKDALKLSDWKRAAMMKPKEKEMVEMEQLSSSNVPEPLPLLLPLPAEVKTYLDTELPGWMNIDAESPASFPPSSLLFPSSTTTYNNKASGSSNATNSLYCLSHARITPQPMVVNSVPLTARKKGTHVRAKPIRRKKATPPSDHQLNIVLENTPSSYPAQFPLRGVDRESCDTDSEKGEKNEELSDTEQDAHNVGQGVAALLQLGSGSSSTVPYHSGGANTFCYSTRYPGGEHAASTMHPQGVVAGVKRSRDLVREEDWWGGLTALPATDTPLKRSRPDTDNVNYSYQQF